MSKFNLAMAGVVVAALLGGCASNLVKVSAGSDRVSVAEATQVSSCQRKGATTVSVLEKVGFISRSIEDVDADLSQLARNAALESGADTVVPGERPEIGKRTFTMYKCRP
ncbi:DUF4156 domain-containing protein [Burkholderiaceae bacterium DAT-1]|nr:DUF4156 domain-containing protein [Burkholderiaceae bacterium DAT-1]